MYTEDDFPGWVNLKLMERKTLERALRQLNKNRRHGHPPDLLGLTAEQRRVMGKASRRPVQKRRRRSR